MADMKIAEKVEPLKKWDKLVKRNANGQFERGSKALAGAGRPKGSLNRPTMQLREAILGAREREREVNDQTTRPGQERHCVPASSGSSGTARNRTGNTKARPFHQRDSVRVRWKQRETP